MGEVVMLPVIRRESPELAAQDERRFRLTDAAKERNRRKKATEGLSLLAPEDSFVFTGNKIE